MSIEWELPNIGEGVEEADVAEILVAPGDSVEAGQALMELETEKAVIEFPAPHSGKIETILVEAGDTIQVGQSIIVVSDDESAGNSKPTNESQAADDSPKKSSSDSETSEKSSAESDTKADAHEPSQAKPAKSQPAQSTQTEMVTGQVDFPLPQLGEGVESADIAEILVSEGDTVAVGDSLMELETEKAVVELPSEHAGKITKIHVSEGDTVSVGQTVITFETSSVVADEPKSKKSETSSKATEKPKAESDSRPASAEPAAKREPESNNQKSAPTKKAQSSRENASSGTPVPAAPSTRRLARKLGVDLRNVRGTASGGRISQEDVQEYVRSQLTNKSQLAIRGNDSAGQLIAGGSIAPPPLPDFSQHGVIEREKMNKLSRTAAENLLLSWTVIPHVTHHDLADITNLESARKQFTQGIGKNGPKVTMTAIVMKALAICLQTYPKFNSSLDPETFEIVFKRYYNIGCAVDTPNGLLVPVIKNCDEKSILEIAVELSDLAGKARDRKLQVDQMQGATCTVTNLGGIGGVGFTPIVNYPEVCILGMSRGQQELKMIDGQISERLMLPLSLSYDHRVINGADAARFVATFCNLLANPFQLLTTV